MTKKQDNKKSAETQPEAAPISTAPQETVGGSSSSTAPAPTATQATATATPIALTPTVAERTGAADQADAKSQAGQSDVTGTGAAPVSANADAKKKSIKSALKKPKVNKKTSGAGVDGGFGANGTIDP